MRPATGESEPGIDLSPIRELEERLDNFRIQTSDEMTIAGNAWQGYALNVPKCEQTAATPGTGACCLPDGTCEVVTPGQCLLDGGTFLGGSCDPNPCPSPPDCTTCDDLPPTNPLGPPVHIHITRTLSGSCGTGTLTGTVEYDLDLGFTEQTVGGHFFCAHSIFDNGFGAFWTGHFFCNGAPFYEHGDGSTQGFGGLLGRDRDDCSWWFNLSAFLPTSCGGCGLGGFDVIFEMIAGPGDPSGVYNFTQTTAGGFTMDTTLTIS